MIIGTSWFFYQKDRQVVTDSSLIQVPNKLSVIQQDLFFQLREVMDDVRFLNNLIQTFQTQSTSDDLNNMERAICSLGRAKSVYDQVRLIDAAGNEVIRFNQSGECLNQSSNQLQNKSHRYYLQKASQLQPGQIYISEFDLNIENREVEVPYKPMIRFVMPVFDKNDKIVAYIVINFSGEKLLNSITKYETDNKVISLLNEQGYLLKSNVESEAWGFMFNDGKNLTFGNKYPEIWRHIQQQETSIIETTDGLFEALRISFEKAPCISNKSKNLSYSGMNWYLVSFIEHKHLQESLFSISNRYLFSTLLIIVLLFALFWKIYKTYQLRLTKMEALLNKTYHDSVTNSFNRVAFMDYTKELKNSDVAFACLYIDIDRFKSFNDIHGHDIGDKVLAKTADELHKLLRNDDVLFRMGGDEFLIILKPVVDKTLPEKIMQRITAEFEKPFTIENQRLTIQLSVGFALSSESGHDIESLIKTADQKMYEAKTKNRQTSNPV